MTLLFLCLPSWALADSPLPRVLMALYDSREEISPRTSQIHRFLEMPANHLGYDIHYYDVNRPLPAPDADIAGIIVWFNSGVEVPDADAYLEWLEAAAGDGKKLVILESGGMGDRYRTKPELLARWNRVLAHVGVKDHSGWNAVTYPAAVESIDREMMGFERKIGPGLPPFGSTEVIPGRGTSHLRVGYKTAEEHRSADLVVTGPGGGYIAEDYALYHVVEQEESKISQWFVNPFRFLRLSLGDGVAPIPDVTTLNGRRIFYSHIDGDGWNNVSEIPEYRKTQTIAAEVMRKELLVPYADFPFTVGLIAADVDPECYGVKDSARAARDIFALPNVEPGSHTLSHPLFWRFFADYTPEKEKPFLDRYPPRPRYGTSLVEAIKGTAEQADWSSGTPLSHAAPHRHAGDTVRIGRNDESEEEIMRKYYQTPRSYACAPFDLNREITGSIEAVGALAPEGKRARLIQWSGDTSPFEAALAVAREAELLNINGGDSRFDNEYPSYSSVAPVGLKIGDERQIYSSNSNENTYTRLWTDRFYGFRYLQTTVRNTEIPIRVRPFNIYFHMYSAEKQASLTAVKENFDFARRQDIIPITASDYAAIAGGFFSVRLTPAGPLAWTVKNRGALQTLRFDQPGDLAVDWEASRGVMGQRHFQDSLYITLDPAQSDIRITLKNQDKDSDPGAAPVPYLIESKWQIKDLHVSKFQLTFAAQGFGEGAMAWQMPEPGSYRVKATRKASEETLFETTVSTDSHSVLPVAIAADAVEPVTVSITREQQ